MMFKIKAKMGKRYFQFLNWEGCW